MASSSGEMSRILPAGGFLLDDTDVNSLSSFRGTIDEDPVLMVATQRTPWMVPTLVSTALRLVQQAWSLGWACHRYQLTPWQPQNRTP